MKKIDIDIAIDSFAAESIDIAIAIENFWERRRRVQSRIFLNQRIDFEYRQLLPGVEMIYLNVCAKSTPLLIRARVYRSISNC